MEYHIGFQLADDIRDLEKDFHKPDQSFLIKVCQNSATLNSVAYVKHFLASQPSSQEIRSFIIDILESAESIADVLQFRFFQDHLLDLIQKFRGTK